MAVLKVPQYIFNRLYELIGMLDNALNDPTRPQFPLKADEWETTSTWEPGGYPTHVPDGEGWWLVSTGAANVQDGEVCAVSFWARRIVKETG